MSGKLHKMPKSASVFSASDRPFAEAMRRVNACNPFLPERIAAERAALGAAFEERGADWNTRPPTAQTSPNHDALIARSREVMQRARAAWPADGRVAREDVVNYEAVVGYWLYQTYA